MTKVATAPEVASPPSSIAAAQKLVEDLARDEVERYQRRAPTRAELFAAQQSEDFGKAAVLREKVEYLEDDQTGRQKRRAAILDLHRLKAEDLEQAAAVLEAEVTDRQAKVKTVVSQLEDLEGDVELRTRYFKDRTKTQDMATEAFAMKQEARRLRQNLKSGSVLDYGRAHGATADELVESLMQQPEMLGPTVASIYEWAEKRKGRGRYGQWLHMIWYGGRIIEMEWQGIIREAPIARASSVKAIDGRMD
jgi:hypothetical protein